MEIDSHQALQLFGKTKGTRIERVSAYDEPLILSYGQTKDSRIRLHENFCPSVPQYFDPIL